MSGVKDLTRLTKLTHKGKIALIDNVLDQLELDIAGGEDTHSCSNFEEVTEMFLTILEENPNAAIAMYKYAPIMEHLLDFED